MVLISFLHSERVRHWSDASGSYVLPIGLFHFILGSSAGTQDLVHEAPTEQDP